MRAQRLLRFRVRLSSATPTPRRCEKQYLVPLFVVAEVSTSQDHRKRKKGQQPHMVRLTFATNSHTYTEVPGTLRPRLSLVCNVSRAFFPSRLFPFLDILVETVIYCRYGRCLVFSSPAAISPNLLLTFDLCVLGFTIAFSYLWRTNIPLRTCLIQYRIPM